MNYTTKDAEEYVSKVFAKLSIREKLLFIYNDPIELSRDKAYCQRLNHRALLGSIIDELHD